MNNLSIPSPKRHQGEKKYYLNKHHTHFFLLDSVKKEEEEDDDNLKEIKFRCFMEKMIVDKQIEALDEKNRSRSVGMRHFLN